MSTFNSDTLMIEEGNGNPQRQASPTGRSLQFQIKPGGTHEVQIGAPGSDAPPERPAGDAFKQQQGTLEYSSGKIIDHGATKVSTSGPSVLRGDYLSTARTPHGRTINSPSEITEDTRINVAGVETSVKAALQQGILVRTPEGQIIDPTATADWKAPEQPKAGKVPTYDFIHPDTRAELNGMTSMLGELGVNAVLSSLIGASVTAEKPDANQNELDSAANKARKQLEDAAYNASQASGKLIKADDVLRLCQKTLDSATAGFDSYCKETGRDGEKLMAHLKSCSAGYQRSFYISFINKLAPQVIRELENAYKLGNRP